MGPPPGTRPAPSPLRRPVSRQEGRATERDTMKHPSSRALYAYWDTLRAGRAAPERSELDPGAIRAILGDVMILEGGGPHRYAVRLAGTRICSLMGREIRGRAFVEAFAPGDWSELHALLDATVASAAPTVANVIGDNQYLFRIDHEFRQQDKVFVHYLTDRPDYTNGNINVGNFERHSLFDRISSTPQRVR